MDYQELRDYALQCSLEHHLCNVDELLEEGKTLDEIMQMVEGVDHNGIVIFPFHWEDVVVWEPYEYYEPSSLAESISDMRGANLFKHLHVLEMVNGKEWVNNFKKEGAEQ